MRLTVRAVIVEEGRLLLVNAWPGRQSELWCAPGGGAEDHASLPNNLKREVYEELGFTIDVGVPCLVNEFHDPTRNFHQVEVFFRAHVLAGQTSDHWCDPEGVVNRHCWVTKTEASGLVFRPQSLVDVAFGQEGLSYDVLETIVK